MNYFNFILKLLLFLRAILNNGIVSGSFINNGVITCGGLLCRPVSGIYTKSLHPQGYTHVATIPAGSSNISIIEIKDSKNYLVLKTSDGKYLFNGNNSISPNGQYEINDTIFEYNRIDNLIGLDTDGKIIDSVTEWIISKGPITEAFDLLAVGQDINPGIKYEYLLPIPSNLESYEDHNEFNRNRDTEILRINNAATIEETTVSTVERRKRKFQWKIVGYTPCSKSCGGGEQTPIMRCIREAPIRFYSPRRCSHIDKQQIDVNLLLCNTQPCPAYWKLNEWSECICHKNHGYKEREIRCVQELATGIVIQVNNAGCMEEEPLSKKKCDCFKFGGYKKRHPSYRNEKHRMHAHFRAPETIIMNNSTGKRVSRQENDRRGLWLVSDWNQHCTADCGTGIEYRSIFCDRTPPNINRCDLRFTPENTRLCENEKKCDMGEWFTSSWNQCNGDCFNLTKSRDILCIRNQLIVDDDECKDIEKPNAIENCTLTDVEYCKSRWHYSIWTDCSKSCDGGTQRRTVRCLEYDLAENTLRESKNCRYSEREPIYRSCNTHKCQEPRVELIQNDITPSCMDEFSNCHLVVKARLCSYDYYKQNCCYSCGRINSEII